MNKIISSLNSGKPGATNKKGTVLVITSSSDTLITKDGRPEKIGFYLNELVIPLQAAMDIGYDIALATPKGNKPVMDPHSASETYFGGSIEALGKALDLFESHPAMQAPLSFRAAIEKGLENYVAIYAPGGHPPMVDLMQDEDLGEILRHFHSEGKVTALLCHGPIAILSAMANAAAFRAAMVADNKEAAKKLAVGWQYAGYRMTVFSNEEEHYAEKNLMGGKMAPFYVYEALEVAGGRLEKSPNGIFTPHIVEDRELITGQNPPSDGLMAEYFVKALERQRAARLIGGCE
ncbi:type 1 glutamine amidotransferase domain-containing protein [Puia sp.]|uniref:type 1 glutamine amidotransferase domain-containing protein n=1 Tax=Puia sp. TaxID=2045100 RepID=UPI002F417CF4